MFNARGWIGLGLLSAFAVPAMAQSFRVQCPPSTITHPVAANNNSEPPYNGPDVCCHDCRRYSADTDRQNRPVNGAIKCQQISGGDGYASMADGTQTYLFAFGPLSGLADMAAGRPGTEFPNVFNTTYTGTVPLRPGDPATTDDNGGTFTYNGAVGLTNDLPNLVSVYDISEVGHTVTVVGNAPLGVAMGDHVVIANVGTGYNNTTANPFWVVTGINIPNPFFPTTLHSPTRRPPQDWARSPSRRPARRPLPRDWMATWMRVRSWMSG